MRLRLTILGSGPAQGVPSVSQGWGQCDPAEPRNRRTRSSALLDIIDDPQRVRILIDTSPDLREQCLRHDIRTLDAIFLTHAHSDHLHGIDDLREINRVIQAPLPVFGTLETLNAARARFPYAFGPKLDLETEGIWRPWLEPHPVDSAFTLFDHAIKLITLDHGHSSTAGLRLGGLAYTTDVVRLDETAMEALMGVQIWVVGCITDTPHPTHAHLDAVLAWAARLKPKRIILTHMGPRLDYGTLRRALPEGIEPGYDGMVIDVVPEFPNTSPSPKNT